MPGGGTVRRWDGDEFMAGGIIRRWDGSEWHPAPGAIIASGGSIFDVGGYRVHVFNTAGSLDVTSGGGDVEVLLVGGGGAGSSGTAGGGGGGEFILETVPVTVGLYGIVIGAGGAAPSGVTSPGSNGGDTTGLGLTALGGGRGAYTVPGGQHDATDGGNGGGACDYSGQIGAPGLAINAGQDATQGGALGSGGGWGGAGAGGTNPAATREGGIGRSNDWLGTAIYYAGGGGGSCSDGTSMAGGLGGGGAGNGAMASAGAANTGGGGGGGWYYANGLGAAGGSGIVLIRYPL